MHGTLPVVPLSPKLRFCGGVITFLVVAGGEVASSFRHQPQYQPPSKEWRGPRHQRCTGDGPGGDADVILAASPMPSMTGTDEDGRDVEPPSDDDELLSLDASDLSSLISSRRVTCVRLMEATLRRIDQINPTANAIVSLRPQGDLLAKARARDADLEDGGGVPRGWLHGIPIAIKDTFHAAGLPTTMGGSPLFSGQSSSVEKRNDPHVQRIVEAGAIIIGKTNAPEFALGSNTYNPTFGRTPNPYDPTKTVGGSSGGAVAALAHRMLCLADGSDMMGSLRNPAGWTNLYSHRPTAGMLLSNDENDAKGVDVDDHKDPPLLPYPISTVGPMARCPTDCARMLETMVGGPDVFDASAVSKVDVHTVGEGPLRIGWLADWGRSYPMEDGVLDLCRDALERGFVRTNLDSDTVAVEVLDVPSPPFSAEALWRSWTTIRSETVSSDLIDLVGGVDVLRREAERGNVKPEAMWEVERGLTSRVDDVDEAVKIAAEWSSRCESLFEDYDALALPTAQLWPFPVEWDWPHSVGGRPCDTYHRWMEVVVPCSLGGLPCVTIPAGFGRDGGGKDGGGSLERDGRGDLPVGVQLFGPRWSDSMLLSLAQMYHERTNWPSRRPPPKVNT